MRCANTPGSSEFAGAAGAQRPQLLEVIEPGEAARERSAGLQGGDHLFGLCDLAVGRRRGGTLVAARVHLLSEASRDIFERTPSSEVLQQRTDYRGLRAAEAGRGLGDGKPQQVVAQALVFGPGQALLQVEQPGGDAEALLSAKQRIGREERLGLLEQIDRKLVERVLERFEVLRLGGAELRRRVQRAARLQTRGLGDHMEMVPGPGLWLAEHRARRQKDAGHLRPTHRADDLLDRRSEERVNAVRSPDRRTRCPVRPDRDQPSEPLEEMPARIARVVLPPRFGKGVEKRLKQTARVRAEDRAAGRDAGEPLADLRKKSLVSVVGVADVGRASRSRHQISFAAIRSGLLTGPGTQSAKRYPSSFGMRYWPEQTLPFVHMIAPLLRRNRHNMQPVRPSMMIWLRVVRLMTNGPVLTMPWTTLT